MRTFWSRVWNRVRGPSASSPGPGPGTARARRSGVSARPKTSAAELASDFHARWSIWFTDPHLLYQALTHRSFVGENGRSPVESNERMEFLGDSVLELVVNEYLYREYPESREGDLTKKRSLLVSRNVLAERAQAGGLGDALLLSGAEDVAGGRARDSILSDSFEAVIGALYLDQGLDVARRFIRDALLDRAPHILADESHVNFKSVLQELVQARGRVQPRYRVRAEEGPDHEKTFVVEVTVRGESLGSGTGRNKKEAEQRAAQAALDTIKRGTTPRPDGESG